MFTVITYRETDRRRTHKGRNRGREEIGYTSNVWYRSAVNTFYSFCSELNEREPRIYFNLRFARE